MKRLLWIAVLFTAMVTAALASPTGAITDWLFGTPADNYMETQWYVYTGFTTFYAQTGFDENKKADLGFATRFGDLYFGLSYNGNIFGQEDFKYTELGTTFNGKPAQVRQYVGAIDLKDENITKPDHNIGILLGFLDMGVLLGLETNYRSFKVEEDFQIKSKIATDPYEDYASYKAEYGTLTPSLKWGMARDLTDNGIRPAIKLALKFDIDSTEYEKYEEFTNNSGVQDYAKNEGTYISTNNSTELELAFNLGGYTLMSTESGFNFSLDLDFTFTSKFYDENQYSWDIQYGLIKKYVTEKKKGYFTTDDSTSVPTTTFTEDYTDTKYAIEPSFALSWSSEKVGVGAKFHLPVEITSKGYTVNSMADDNTGTSKKYTKASTYKEIGISFSPILKFGGQYRLVPDKFNINFGATIELSSIEQTESETETVTPASTKKEVTPKSDGTKSTFSLGATFYFNDNVFLDAYTGVKDVSELSFYGKKGVTTFTGILLSVKF